MKPARNQIEGVGGWLLVYVVGSIPLLGVYAMGLSGWFFDYPLALMAAIFLALATPLLLLLLKSPRAPRWNVAMLWTIVVLMALRSVSVFLVSELDEHVSAREAVGVGLILAAIVSVSAGWAAVWTKYFHASTRVRNTFGRYYAETA